jgi:D-alanyl-D-alanine carboxypeptidase/D-alanyl-D-alanine-endopeptidase (penicillin-binding protein 4)
VPATIDSLLGHPRYRNAQWGALIVDAESGDTLYSRQAGRLFVPASNQKIITAAAALAVLGPEFRFETRVASSGVVRDSALAGDLVVFGSGDPSFSDRIRGDALIPLREMADSLRVRGISTIAGRLRRGTPQFTDSPIGFGWAWDDLGASYGATVGDLMLNDAFAAVRIEIDGVPDTVRKTAPRYRHFLDAFQTALVQRGVKVRDGYEWTSTVSDSALETMFTYRSAPLSELLTFFNKASQNQVGEVLLKTMGRVRTGSGTADSGVAVVRRYLIAVGADSMGFVVRDGSGLSRHNLVSPETLIRVLDAARRDSTFGVLYESLPVAGVDGTLERRFHNTRAQGNAHAKTGSMDRVRTMSGYVTSADGRMLMFSLLATGWTVPGTEVDDTFDAIVAMLARMTVR